MGSPWRVSHATTFQDPRGRWSIRHFIEGKYSRHTLQAGGTGWGRDILLELVQGLVVTLELPKYTKNEPWEILGTNRLVFVARWCQCPGSPSIIIRTTGIIIKSAYVESINSPRHDLVSHSNTSNFMLRTWYRSYHQKCTVKKVLFKGKKKGAHNNLTSSLEFVCGIYCVWSEWITTHTSNTDSRGERINKLHCKFTVQFSRKDEIKTSNDGIDTDVYNSYATQS